MDYPCIQVTQGLSGWFAVMLVDYDGFPEPQCTGIGRYAMQADAIKEAKMWAEAESLPFYPPGKLDETPVRQDVAQQLRELLPNVKIIQHDGFIEATTDTEAERN